jgi:hypothetical protein
MSSILTGVNLSAVRADKQFYQQLNCAPSSSAAQIKAEFRILARRIHPDKQQRREHTHDHREIDYDAIDDEIDSIVVSAAAADSADDSAAETEFKALLRAFHVLSDPDSRALYDEYLASELAIPFDDFCALKASEGHVGVHWARKPEKPSIVATGVDASVARPLNMTVQRDTDERFVYRPAVSEPYVPDQMAMFRAGKI